MHILCHHGNRKQKHRKYTSMNPYTYVSNFLFKEKSKQAQRPQTQDNLQRSCYTMHHHETPL